MNEQLRRATPEEQEMFLSGLQADADKSETAGDVKGWIRAMRNLIAYAGWNENPPESILVTPEFYELLESDLRQRNVGMEIAAGVERGMIFRRIPIFKGVLCHAG